jgi:hypothetical protein
MAEHNLRCTIPPRRDIFGHEPLLPCLFKPVGMSKITNLELAARVNEQVPWPKITVHTSAEWMYFRPLSIWSMKD